MHVTCHPPALQVSSILSFSLAQGGNNTVMDRVQTVYQCCGVRGAEGYDQWRDYLEVSTQCNVGSVDITL